jgi:hypothetical protein
MLFGSDRSAGGLKLLSLNRVIDRLGVSSYHCRTKNLLVVIVDAALDVFNVDGHNTYETL